MLPFLLLAAVPLASPLAVAAVSMGGILSSGGGGNKDEEEAAVPAKVAAWDGQNMKRLLDDALIKVC